MKIIPVETITEGMVLDKTLFMENGQVLLSEGTQLRNSYKQRLKQFGITEIYIKEEQDKTTKNKIKRRQNFYSKCT